MNKKILSSITDPEALETLFRSDKEAFIAAFPQCAEGAESELIRFWRIRLESEPPTSGASLPASGASLSTSEASRTTSGASHSTSEASRTTSGDSLPSSEASLTASETSHTSSGAFQTALEASRTTSGTSLSAAEVSRTASGATLFSSEWIVPVIIAFLVAVLALIPSQFRSLDSEVFNMRNLPLIVFSGLIAYTLWRQKVRDTRTLLIIILPLVVMAVYLNLLPEPESHSSILVFMHAPLLFWCLAGLAQTRLQFRNEGRVFGFLRYTGELITMTGLILIAGLILSIMTVTLFGMIGMEITRFYMNNIALAGAAASPVVAAWIISRYPAVTGRVVPVIARVFTPLVLVSAVVYLTAILFSGISITTNREFLVMFNLLLLGVMAIIVFSIAELERSTIRKINLIMLFLLAAVTLIINCVALTAIISRLTLGITPNRLAVLLSNLAVFIHLLLLLPGLWNAGFRSHKPDRVVKLVSGYMPVYFFYTIFIIIAMPLLW